MKKDPYALRLLQRLVESAARVIALHKLNAPDCIIDNARKGILDSLPVLWVAYRAMGATLQDLEVEGIKKSSPCFFCGNHHYPIEMEDPECKKGHSLDTQIVMERSDTGCPDFTSEGSTLPLSDIDHDIRGVRERYSEEELLKAFRLIGEFMSEYVPKDLIK